MITKSIAANYHPMPDAQGSDRDRRDRRRDAGFDRTGILEQVVLKSHASTRTSGTTYYFLVTIQHDCDNSRKDATPLLGKGGEAATRQENSAKPPCREQTGWFVQDADYRFGN